MICLARFKPPAVEMYTRVSKKADTEIEIDRDRDKLKDLEADKRHDHKIAVAHNELYLGSA